VGRSLEPSPLNDFMIGEEVQATRKLINWYGRNLNFCYVIPKEKEIRPKYLKEAYFWLMCYTTKFRPKGKVTTYGDREDDSIRKNLGVEFKIGRRKMFAFVSEDDLTKVV
jgi:hypothetical protein